MNIIAAILVYQAPAAPRPHGRVRLATVLVLAGVLFMVIGRHMLRLVYLEGYLDPSRLSVNPQWSPLAMFLIVFAAGVIALWWMIRKYFTAAEPG